jgi:hypothetical protein
VSPLVLCVEAEGCTLARCGITGAACLSGPTNQPTVARPDPRITFTYAGQTAVKDPGNSGPQRVQYPFKVSFPDATIFSNPTNFPTGVKPATMTITASFTPVGESALAALAAQATITLTLRDRQELTALVGCQNASTRLDQTAEPDSVISFRALTPNPFILHNDPQVEANWYMSQDLGVLQVVAGTT